MELNISVKQMLVDLFSIQPQVMRLYKNNDKYQTLLKFLCARDYYNDENIPYPTLKDIEIGTGLPTHQVRKQVKEIYNSFFDFEIGYYFDFSIAEIWFNVEYLKRYSSFKCSPLQYLPRVGENFNLPFLNAKMGISHFYVKEVRHSFETKNHIIEINLKGGFYNSYWHNRLDKALELGEIGFGEQFHLYEFQLKEKLGLRKR